MIKLPPLPGELLVGSKAELHPSPIGPACPIGLDDTRIPKPVREAIEEGHGPKGGRSERDYGLIKDLRRARLAREEIRHLWEWYPIGAAMRDRASPLDYLARTIAAADEDLAQVPRGPTEGEGVQDSLAESNSRRARLKYGGSDRPRSSEALISDESDAHRPIDLRPILAGDLKPRTPDMLRRCDGNALIYAGLRHWFYGEPEAGKSWCASYVVAECLLAGLIVVYVDWESSPEDLALRLRAQGVPDQLMLGGLRYVSPPGPVHDYLAIYSQTVTGAALVVFDACTEAMVADGFDPNSNLDVERWAQSLPKLVRDHGAAYVVIDHVPKDRDSRGRYAIGGGHKLGLTDVSYQFTPVDPIAPGLVGRVSIRVRKDRPGGVNTFALGDRRVADMVIDATNPADIEIVLYPPKEWTAPTRLMEEILAEARKAPVPRTRSALSRLVKGKQQAKLQAIEGLIDQGCLVAVDQSTRYPKYVPREEDSTE